MNFNNLRPTVEIVPLFTSKNPATDITGGFDNIVFRKAFTCNIKHVNVNQGIHSIPQFVICVEARCPGSFTLHIVTRFSSANYNAID
jgi:hypothetical protein